MYETRLFGAPSVAVDVFKVDLAVFGGDLFHENKPSRYTMYKTVKILSEHCFGDCKSKEKGVVILPHPDYAKNSSWNGFNFQDSNFSIKLPIFGIHGNHDEPTGEEYLSAMDILHNTRVLNYIGKSDDAEYIKCLPVQIYRGRTRLAIYGVGNVRNERLKTLLESGKLEFVEPYEYSHEEVFKISSKTKTLGGFVKVLLLHQGRNQYSPRSYVPESSVSNFDLVIWGHEHECLIEPIAFGEMQVSQPGSTVVTSLCDSEASQKKVAVLKVNRCYFKMMPFQLKTVRPYLYKSYLLSNLLCGRRYLNEHEMQLLIQETLKTKLEEMLSNQNRESKLPLVRIRVDYTGYCIISNVRFGQAFVGRVANPNEILLFHRTKSSSKKTIKPGEVGDAKEAELADSSVAEMIDKYLGEENIQSMRMLPLKKMTNLVHTYVLSGDEKLISKFVENHLSFVQNELMKVEFSEFANVAANCGDLKTVTEEGLHSMEFNESVNSLNERGKKRIEEVMLADSVDFWGLGCGTKKSKMMSSATVNRPPASTQKFR